MTPRPGSSPLTCYFRSGDALRSRSVSSVVLSGVLDIPPLPGRLIADCEREASVQLGLQPGDVEALSLVRARTRWPEYKRCVQAVARWMQALEIAGALDDSDAALMVCRGARYHHDGAQYGGSAFCNLFVGEDKGLDLHFPSTGQRIALIRGTAVLFDTGQPHAVIQRGSSGFDVLDFGPECDCTLPFLSWELPVEHVHVAAALQIAFDHDPANALELKEQQVCRAGLPTHVCPDTGAWRNSLQVGGIGVIAAAGFTACGSGGGNSRSTAIPR